MNQAELGHYNIPGLDMRAGLQRAGDNPDIYLSFLQNFYDHGQHYRSNLQQALTDTTHARLRQQVHGLRGVAATLGAWQLDKSCADLLQAISDPSDQPVPQLIAHIFHTLDKLITAIRESTVFDQVSQPSDENPVHGLLQDFTLVLIEDDGVFREVLINGLRRHFGIIRPFASKQDALFYLQRQTSLRRSVIISDVRLRDGSGIEIAKVLAQSHPDTFVLLISGEAVDTHEPEGIQNYTLILKPFSIDTLLNLSKAIALNNLSHAPD